MAEIRIGRGTIYVTYVGEGRYTMEVLSKTGRDEPLEMSRAQLDTLGKSFQAIAKGKKIDE
jgi:hypothetical protein